MVNQDLYEVYVPATHVIAGAVREFHVALEIAKTCTGEVWIRRNLEMEAWVNAASPSKIDS
jgi:hypothetical protein